MTYCTWRSVSIFMVISRSIHLRMRNISDKICRENQNTHFVFSNFLLFRKSCRLWDNVEKSGTAGQATDGNMVRAHRMLRTYGYRHTLTLCNTHCLSIATVVARTHLSDKFIVTLRVLFKLREHQQIHNSTIYILFLLLCCYILRELTPKYH